MAWRPISSLTRVNQRGPLRGAMLKSSLSGHSRGRSRRSLFCGGVTPDPRKQESHKWHSGTAHLQGRVLLGVIPTRTKQNLTEALEASYYRKAELQVIDLSSVRLIRQPIPHLNTIVISTTCSLDITSCSLTSRRSNADSVVSDIVTQSLE